MTNSPSLSPHYTALRCLFIMCMWRGVQLKPENFACVNETDTLGSVLRIIREVGLRAKVLHRYRWRALSAIGHTYPVMGILNDTRWVLVVKVVDTAGE